jgi:tRNA A-37 threonylcarbamoyl transferase component Bud32
MQGSETGQQILNGELFVLASEKQGKSYLVNPTIKLFLNAFQMPNTLENVVNEFAKKANCEAKQIAEAMQFFFENMKRQGFLVRETKIENAEQTAEIISPFIVGQAIDHYFIEREIDDSSHVALYLAKDITTAQQVVLKVLKILPSYTETELKRKKHFFEQEFYLMYKLQNQPNVCKFIKFVDGDFPYAVMEFIEGESIKNFSKKESVTLSEKLDAIGQTFQLIGSLHKHKMLHGDIHSGNFLVTSENIVKLIDFGLSNHETPHQSEIIRIGGVTHYIPPERIHQSSFKIVQKRANYRAEIFQLGIVAYRILYQKMPFVGFTWQDLSEAILNKTPLFESHTPKGEKIPDFAIQILKQTLHKQAEKRFEQAMELHEKWHHELMKFQKNYMNEQFNRPTTKA